MKYLHKRERSAAEQKQQRRWKSAILFDGSDGVGIYGERWERSVVGTNFSCYGSLAWQACAGLETELERCVVLQSSQRWRKTAAEKAGRRGIDGAQRFR